MEERETVKKLNTLMHLDREAARLYSEAIPTIGESDVAMDMQRFRRDHARHADECWQAIRDLQIASLGPDAVYATMFERGEEPITPHIADAARAFGAHGVRISQPEEVGPALREALSLCRPAVIEVMVDTEPGSSGGLTPGWWDVPVPGYLTERRRRYEQERREEQLL